MTQDSLPTQVHRDVYSVSYSDTDDQGNQQINNGNQDSILLNTSSIAGDRNSTVSTGGASGGSSGGGHQSNAKSADGQQELISRTTQQTKQQQTKTVTKTIVSRETRFIGPDGRPIDLESSSYGTTLVNGQPSLAFNPHDYGNAAAFNGQPDFDYHNYQDYPLSPPTPPSVLSDSPPPVTARRTNATTDPSVTGINVGGVASHLPQNNLPPSIPRSGYDELDATLDYSHHLQQGAQHFNDPYGYIRGAAASANQAAMYDVYGQQEHPSGFLDRRPSYSEDPHSIYSGHQLPNGVVTMTTTTANGTEVRWRNPDLQEVIDFLSHPEAAVRINAAAYLQHLCFMDDKMKQRTRSLGGIPLLVSLLTQDIPEVQRNACGALRNLSYGRKNDENKRAIRNSGGIPSLVRLLRTQADNLEVCELVTGILWNLSSCEDLKRPILDDCLVILAKEIILPCSQWDTNTAPNPLLAVMTPGAGIISGNNTEQPLYWSNLFRNASGVLRNVSSAGEYARRRMRECQYFVESLIFLTRTAINKNDMDNKSIENVVCILRNLSYRCQEVIDPNYDSHPIPASTAGLNTSSSSGNHPLSPSNSRSLMGSMGSKVGDNLGTCFGGNRKKGKDSFSPTASSSADHLVQQTQNMTLRSSSSTTNANSHYHGSSSTLPRSKVLESIRGYELLWQPEIVQPYLSLLSGCSNPETLEAAAGSIQNLCACYWQASIDIRAAVRKEKGLPVLVELLRMQVDRVVCAVATALRNLAMDSRNKELIGKYAMKDLVSKLPNGNAQHDYGTSDDTVAAVLATLNEVVSKNADFAKSLLEVQGMERLTFIIKNKNNKFSPRVFKFTSQLLYNMWQHIELRDVYKKAGYKESHFVIRPSTLSRNSSSVGGGGGHHNNTLSRPMSTQSGTRYEDRTLPRGRQYQRVSQSHCFFSFFFEWKLSLTFCSL